MHLKHNFIYNTIYQILSIIFPIATGPYLSRVIGAHGIGIYTFTTSIVSYFILFGVLGLNTFGSREIAYHQDDIEKRSRVFWEIFLLKLLSVTASSVIFLICLPFFSKSLFIFYLIEIIIFFSTSLDISWFFIGMEDFKDLVVRGIVARILIVLSVFVFVKTAHDVWIYVLINCLGTLISSLWIWPLAFRKITFVKIPFRDILLPLIPSIALFMPTIATSIYLSINKVMLGALDSIEAAGYFQQSDNIIRMILMLITSLGTVMMPHIAKLFAEGNKQKIDLSLEKSFHFISFLGFPAFIGLTIISDHFSVLFYGKNFLETGKIMSIECIIIVFIGFSNIVGMQYLLPTNKVKLYTLSVTLGAISNIIANPMLILMFGAEGAAAATALSEIIVLFVQTLSTKQDIPYRKLFFSEDWKYLIAAIAMGLILFPTNMFIGKSWIGLILASMGGFVIYIIIISLLGSEISRIFLIQIKEYFYKKGIKEPK